MARRTVRRDGLVSVVTTLALRCAPDRHRSVCLRAVVAGFAFDLSMARVIEAVAACSVVAEVAMTVGALRTLHLELVRYVTLHAVPDYTRGQPTMHRRDAVDRRVTSRTGAHRCFRRGLLMGIVTSAAFGVVRILAVELLRDPRTHFMAAQTLLGLRLQRFVQTVGRNLGCHRPIEFMTYRAVERELGHLAELDFGVLVTAALRACFIGGRELVQSR